jgi:transcriptional regulator GlxA family with amidase domain
MMKRTRYIAAACSGVVLLAQAGLLDGCRATTCWWLLPWFAERFPEVKLYGERLVVRSGERWTAAAGTAYLHLGLALVRELAGERVASVTARLLLVENRRGSQSPFVGPLMATHRAGQPQIERMLRYLDRHLSEEVSVASAARELGITERTLARRMKQAVGMTPLAYLQSQRVARAKQLLEQTALSFEQIVLRCGYQDVASFRKLFTRYVGMPPGEYRERL